MLELSEVANILGFKTLGVKVSLKKLVKDAPLPCILHWNQSHFVVLYSVKKRLGRSTIFSIADPALGKFEYEEKDLIQYWYASEFEKEGIALLFDNED